MADFINRLAERTLGLTSVVQPLVVSRFAPGSTIVGRAAGIPSGFQPREAETEGAGLGILGSPEREMPTQLYQAVSTPPLVLQEVRAISAPASLPISAPKEIRSQATQVSLIRASLDTAPLPEHRSESGTGEQGDVSSSPSYDLSAAEGPAVPPPPALVSTIFPTIPLLVPSKGLSAAGDQPAIPRPLAETPDSVARSQASPEMPLSESRESLKRQPVALSPGSQEMSTLAIVRPNVTAQQERAISVPGRREDAFSEPSSSPPTIRVTIGRVEVRAVQPSAPPPSPAPRGPALSLDDYLKQRSEGVR